MTFGERADRWLERQDTPMEDYTTILRARLYSLNARGFAFTLEKELGWTREEGEDLWPLIVLPMF